MSFDLDFTVYKIDVDVDAWSFNFMELMKFYETALFIL